MVQPEQRMTEAEFQAVARQLDALVRAFEALPFPEVREMAFDMLQAVDALHREALGRLIEQLEARGQQSALQQAMRDPVVHTLLQLYDLVPGDEQAAASRSAATSPGGVFIPLTLVQHDTAPAPNQLQRPRFAPVAPLDDVPPGTLRAFDVAGMRVVVAHVDGELYAARNTCPGSMAPLELGSFAPPVVVCPWHNEAYDIRTGKRVDGSPLGATGRDLAVLPVTAEDGLILLALGRGDLPDEDGT